MNGNKFFFFGVVGVVVVVVGEVGGGGGAVDWYTQAKTVPVDYFSPLASTLSH